jgi:hypothetical protein
MAKLSTAAWVAHNLGLAACFGGHLFGKLALNPKLDAPGSKTERAKMLNAAWNRYNVVNAVSLGTAAATWFVGRASISGESIGENARNLVLAKDALPVRGLDPHRARQHYHWAEARASGARRRYANPFGVRDEVEASGVPLLTEYRGHQSLRKLVKEGFEIITF